MTWWADTIARWYSRVVVVSTDLTACWRTHIVVAISAIGANCGTSAGGALIITTDALVSGGVSIAIKELTIMAGTRGSRWRWVAVGVVGEEAMGRDIAWETLRGDTIAGGTRRGTCWACDGINSEGQSNGAWVTTSTIRL
jgi:hypothetical protein